MISANRRFVRVAVAALLMLATGLLSACGDDDKDASPTAAPATYVGALPGTRVLVGIATNRSRIRAYACDGRDVGTWFDGTIKDGAAVLTAAGGQRLELKLGDGSASGSVTLGDGRERAFEAGAAEGDAGLYRGTHKRNVAGWIVLADGTQRGVFGTPTNFTAAPRITSKAIGDGRISITPIPIPSAGPQLASIRIAPNGGIG